LFMMHVKKKEAKREDNQIFKDLKEGFNYTFRFAPIKHLLLLLGLVSLMGSSYQVLMPIYAKEILHGGSQTFGFLMGAAGLGALLGAVYLASRESILKLGRLIPIAAAMFGAGLVILAFSRFFILSAVVLVFTGVGMMLHTAASNTIIQTITDDDKRGRVMSFYTLAIVGTAPFGSLLAGSLAKLIGTPVTILFGGITCVTGAAIFLKKLPELKNIVRPVYVKMGIIPEVATAIQTASEPSARTSDPTGSG